jgi:hypothetical protein
MEFLFVKQNIPAGISDARIFSMGRSQLVGGQLKNLLADIYLSHLEQKQN